MTIQAEQFVEAARVRGFDRYAGVPCSYLTPFINYVLQDASLTYVSATNEGDAVALNAGVALAGGRGVTMMQNSGLGNAVSPLTSLTWTFRLPQLLIVTWRGQPGVPDEPQHALMGPITPTLLDTMEIPWELFPTEVDAIGPALDRAVAHMDATGRPYALVMQKGSVAPFALVETPPPEERPHPAWAARISGEPYATRRDALEVIRKNTPVESTVVFASTGYCGRELYALADRLNQLYFVGSMGCVSMFALGFALVRPDLDVVAIDGDGAALMRLGAFATIGAYGPSNLAHVLLDNGVHESTGGQATVAPTVDFGEVARACGYAGTFNSDDVEVIAGFLRQPVPWGARFMWVRIAQGTPADLPRPTIAPEEVARRLRAHIATLHEEED